MICGYASKISPVAVSLTAAKARIFFIGISQAADLKTIVAARVL